MLLLDTLPPPGTLPRRAVIKRQYRYLIALAKEKHFGRAAAACYVSASTLSVAIRELERELGVAIVERGRQFMGLTPEGQRVVDYAQRTAASAAGLLQELAQLKQGLEGRLRIGVIPTAATAVALLTTPFVRRHPLVTVEVLALNTNEIIARLREFELDAGIVYVESGDDDDLQITPLWNENHVLLTGARSGLEGRTTITWKEAAQLPLCLLTRDMQNRKTIDAVFDSLGCAPAPTLETNSIISMMAHVCGGVWSSIAPRAILDWMGIPKGMQVIELVEPSVAWATGLVTHARDPRPPIVEALIAEAKTMNTTMKKSE